ncbi:hypothetical protein MWN33_07040 [Starkeya koreensis]|uniref:Uncharacterized protein n=1 Tax=Ancylobacter koreensis TaxID=266121 RepID=A0ABT0DKI2_9HYPH|nr:hypothetical protein [Ancylobacter koreensis]MCK0207790.1 hypothetical protein [Ancylobacter koreensis]
MNLFQRIVEPLRRFGGHGQAPRRLFVDVRETATSRGFHAMAVLNLIAGHLAGVEIHALTTGAGDELSAIEVFGSDHGLPVVLHGEKQLRGVRADIVFAVREDGRILERWIGKIARRSLVGVIFPPLSARRGMLVVDGNDTPVMARSLARLIDPTLTEPSFTGRPDACAS